MSSRRSTKAITETGARQEEVEQYCQCDIPNAGLPLVGEEICRACGKPV